MTGPHLDPVRGAEVAEKLKSLGVKGTLIKAARLGYITELTCGMPKCFCPEELGGAGYFVARSQTWNDWEPTHEHFPIPKRDGGKATPDNTVLAHRLCNKLDFSISHGLLATAVAAPSRRRRAGEAPVQVRQAGRSRS
jgi:hypothetical protein